MECFTQEQNELSGPEIETSTLQEFNILAAMQCISTVHLLIVFNTESLVLFYTRTLQ